MWGWECVCRNVYGVGWEQPLKEIVQPGGLTRPVCPRLVFGSRVGSQQWDHQAQATLQSLPGGSRC